MFEWQKMQIIMFMEQVFLAARECRGICITDELPSYIFLHHLNTSLKPSRTPCIQTTKSPAPFPPYLRGSDREDEFSAAQDTKEAITTDLPPSQNIWRKPTCA